jgi:hypothetical protein
MTAGADDAPGLAPWWTVNMLIFLVVATLLVTRRSGFERMS